MKQISTEAGRDYRRYRSVRGSNAGNRRSGGVACILMLVVAGQHRIVKRGRCDIAVADAVQLSAESDGSGAESVLVGALMVKRMRFV